LLELLNSDHIETHEQLKSDIKSLKYEYNVKKYHLRQSNKLKDQRINSLENNIAKMGGNIRTKNEEVERQKILTNKLNKTINA